MALEGRWVSVARAGTAWIRREEAYLAGLWLTGALLCISSRTGFSFYFPFKQYAGFFALPILSLLVVSKIGLPRAGRWTPSHPLGRRIRRFFFGGPDRPSVEAIELEFLRSMFLLFISLSVYTNVKVRIPLINPINDDGLFKQLDHTLGLDAIVGPLESWFRTTPAASDFFTGVYLHGYWYMIIIVCLLYLRRDAFNLRWIVMAVCWTYLLGIFVTVALPSLGPFVTRYEEFAWLRKGEIGVNQAGLMDIYGMALRMGDKGRALIAPAFAGIAAFPSLHLGHMTIMGVVAWRTWRFYTGVMVVVGLLTYVATIGFGWHYVCDGIAGILMGVGITVFLHRRMLDWDQRRAIREAAPAVVAGPASEPS
jgi:hypothetical protein